VQKQIYNQRQS